VTRVYRVELMVVDHADIGADGVDEVLASTHYANRRISPQIVSIQERSVEWTDAHPLNQRLTWRDAFRRLFGKET
jgi:hypothetical protein